MDPDTFSSQPSSQSNTRPLLIFTTYLTINTILTLLLSKSIITAYSHNKPTFINIRSIWSRISSHILLTVLSLSVTWYFMLSFFALSYRSWAAHRNVALPAPLHLTDSFDLGVVQTWLSELRLGSWLKDVQLFREAWETVVETQARACWSTPIFGVTTLWSFFIVKEAQVRKIKHAWAYMVLGQLVAISFAMNLFYLAVLVQPIPGKVAENGVVEAPNDRDLGTKKEKVKNNTASELWTLPEVFYTLLRNFTIISTAVVLSNAGSPHFLWWLAVPHLLLLLPPIMHATSPRDWGISHPTKARYNGFYAYHFKRTYYYFMLLEVAELYRALTSNMEAARHLHRHSNVHVYPWHTEVEKIQETVIQNLWRSLMDHPAVSSVGWDSILCTLSYIAWKWSDA